MSLIFSVDRPLVSWGRGKRPLSSLGPPSQWANEISVPHREMLYTITILALFPFGFKKNLMFFENGRSGRLVEKRYILIL